MLGKYQESLLSPGLRFGPAARTSSHAVSRFGAPTPVPAGNVQASQYDMDDPFMAPGEHVLGSHLGLPSNNCLQSIDPAPVLTAC